MGPIFNKLIVHMCNYQTIQSFSSLAGFHLLKCHVKTPQNLSPGICETPIQKSRMMLFMDNVLISKNDKPVE